MSREAVLKSLPQFLLLVLFSLLLVFTERLGWTKAVHGVVEGGIRPVKTALWSGRQKALQAVNFLTFWRSGVQKIKHLEERNRELLVQAQKTQALEEENRILRTQLGVALPATWKLEPVQTLGKTRYLTIDKGENEGVKEGQAVILKNIWVGKVIKVGIHESQVELPTDPESKIPVQTTKTGARGLLVGQFGRGMTLEKVTQGEILDKEDVVTTTGEGGYPKGLILGKVNWAEGEESEVFQRAGVEPVLNFDELETVFLINAR